MALFYISAGASLVLSYLIVWWLKSLSLKHKIFFTPIRERDIHSYPVPRVGGIGLVASFLIVSLALYFINPGWFDFAGELVLGIDRNFLGLILAILVLTVANIKDDYKGIHWSIRLVSQVIASLLVIAFGIEVVSLSNPFGGMLALTAVAGAAIVLIWLVALSNVVNWLDSTDGLASGVSAISIAVLFFLSISPMVDQPETALIGAVALGAILGFLPHNLSKKKAFLGDTGSVFLGFLIGVMAIISGGKIATAFLVLAIPFLDALVVMVTRVVQRRSPFLPDNSHLPHRLLRMGFKPWQINIIYYGLSLVFGLVALNTQTLGKLGVVLMAVLIMIFFVLLYSGKIKIKNTNGRRI